AAEVPGVAGSAGAVHAVPAAAGAMHTVAVAAAAAVNAVAAAAAATVDGTVAAGVDVQRVGRAARADADVAGSVLDHHRGGAGAETLWDEHQITVEPLNESIDRAAAAGIPQGQERFIAGNLEAVLGGDLQSAAGRARADADVAAASGQEDVIRVAVAER